MENNFVKLAAINVNEHTEKKNNLTYLSWAWAVDQLMRADPSANWEYNPVEKFGDTYMVFCSVTAFGKKMTMQLPVMDHRNKAITNPDAFQINTAMQRCLVKAIAIHGLGLYIYAGEDLPVDESVRSDDDLIAEWKKWIAIAANKETLKVVKDDINKTCISSNRADLWNIIKLEIKGKVDSLEGLAP